MKPCSIFWTIRWSVEEDNLTLVPSLVIFLYVGEIEARDSIWGIRTDSWHSSFISLSTVGWIRLVPNVYWYLLPLAPTSTGIINEGSWQHVSQAGTSESTTRLLLCTCNSLLIFVTAYSLRMLIYLSNHIMVTCLETYACASLPFNNKSNNEQMDAAWQGCDFRLIVSCTGNHQPAMKACVSGHHEKYQ